MLEGYCDNKKVAENATAAINWAPYKTGGTDPSACEPVRTQKELLRFLFSAIGLYLHMIDWIGNGTFTVDWLDWFFLTSIPSMILKKKSVYVHMYVQSINAWIGDLGSGITWVPRSVPEFFRIFFEFFFLKHFQESSLELGTQVSKSSPVLHFILQPSQCIKPDARTESITLINIRDRREESQLWPD